MAAGFIRARQISALIKRNQPTPTFTTSHAIIERTLKKESRTYISPPTHHQIDIGYLPRCLAG